MSVTGVIAQLRTTDLERAVRFYTAVLGFALDFRHEDFYAGVRAVHDTPWGTRELALRDADGHTLYFGQRATTMRT